MKEEVDVLNRIVEQFERLNDNIEKSIKMANEMNRPTEVKQLSVFEQTKKLFVSALNQMIMDTVNDFSVKALSIDKDSVEYTKLLLEALKKIRAVLRMKETFEQFFTEDELDNAIKVLEKQIKEAESITSNYYKKDCGIECDKVVYEQMQ